MPLQRNSRSILRSILGRQVETGHGGGMSGAGGLAPASVRLPGWRIGISGLN